MKAPEPVVWLLVAAIAWLIAAGLWGLGLIVIAAFRARRNSDTCRIMDAVRFQTDRWAPALSLAVLPSGTDSEVVETVSSAIRLNYPGLEVIVVCDGSRGTLLSSLASTFDLQRVFRTYRHEIRTAPIHAIYASSVFPGLLLIDKEEAGPSDALNAAVDFSVNPLFAFIPTGTRLHAQPLYRLLEEFLQSPDSLAAVAAPVRLQGSGLFSSMTECARLELTLPDGDGWTGLAAAASGAGTFIVYRRKLLDLADGFRIDSRNPRIDSVLRLTDRLRAWGVGGRVRFLPLPVAWETTNAPLRLLLRRHVGLVESIFRHGGPLLRESPGRVRAAVLHLTAMEVVTPLVELVLLVGVPVAWATGWIRPEWAASAAAVLVGQRFWRSGAATLAECSDRERYGFGQVLARAAAVFLSPLLQPLLTLGRSIAVPMGWKSARRAPRRFSSERRRFESVPNTWAGAQAPATLPAPSAGRPIPAPPPGQKQSSIVPVAAKGSAAPPPPPITWAFPRPVRPQPAPISRRTTIALPGAHTTSMVPAPPAFGTPGAPPPPLMQPIPVVTGAPSAPPPVPGRPAPVTFDVMTHYQIRADAPPGAMPAIQLPSGAGGPIVVTTGSGQITIPPAPPPASAPPAPPAVPHRRQRHPESTSAMRPPTSRDRRNIADDIPAVMPRPAEMAAPPPIDLSALAPPRESAEAEAADPVDLSEPVEMSAPAVEDLSSAAPPIERAEEEPPVESTLPPAPDLDPIQPDLPEKDSAVLDALAAEAAATENALPPAPVENFADDPPRDLAPDFDPGSIPIPALDDEPERPSIRRPGEFETDILPPRRPSEPEAPPRTPPPSNESSAAWPIVVGDEDVGSDPIDLDMRHQDAEPTQTSDTSASMPVVSENQTSDPLDLSELDQEGLMKALEEHQAHLPGDRRGVGETSLMLPAVGDPSEPLELDFNELDLINDGVKAISSSITLEPVQPGDLKRYLETIAQSPMFLGVRPNERNRILSFVRAVRIRKGKDVLTEGGQGRGLFLIHSGKFDIILDEGRRVVATLGPGECFGEMSLLTGDPASATVRAAEDAKLLVVSKEDFPKLTAALPWISFTLARQIASRISKTSARVVDDLKKGMVGRLELVSVASLIQAVQVNAQSGSLVVQSGRRSFTAYFEDGQIFDAVSDLPEAERAFYDVLTWTSGSFRFEPGKRQNPTRRIMTDTVGLLLEGSRRADEARSATGIIKPGSAAPTSDPKANASGMRDAVREVVDFDLTDEVAAMNALSRLPIFSGLRPQQLRQVIASMQELRAAPGDVIVRQGQLGQALYVVGSGVYEVSSRDDTGVQNKLATLKAGDCFGEISLITGEPTSATVSVSSAGALFIIPRQEFTLLLGRVPALGASLARLLAARLSKASQWVHEQSKQGFAGRLETLPPAELVQALNVNVQSGLLEIKSENKTIEIDLLDGQVQDARAGDLRSEEAFFRFLSWTKGSFRFKVGRPSGERTIQSDTIGLLFRGMRYIEELRQNAASQGRTELSTADVAPGGIPIPSSDTGTMRERPPELGVHGGGAAPSMEFKALTPAESDECLQTVAASSVFFRVLPSDRSRILPFLRSVKLPANSVVIDEGTSSPALFIVRSGRFEMLQGDEQHMVAVLGPGECFGEMSMLTGDPSSATIRAIEDVRLLAIMKEDFPKLTALLPWLGLALTRLIAQRLMRASQAMFQEARKGLRGRLELIPPSALIQGIHANRQSGRLTVKAGAESNEPAPTFVAQFLDGEVVSAVLDEIGGDDAFYDFLIWPAGAFSFEPQGADVEIVKNVDTDTVGLLLEGNRRLDDLRSKGMKAPSADTSATTARRMPGEATKRRTRKSTPDIPTLATPQAAVEALLNLPLFRGLTENQMLDVISLMQERKTTAKEAILEQGRASQALFVIADGRFDMTQTDREGSERKIGTLQPGECFGEDALITGEPSTVTFTSRDKGRLFLIPRDPFHGLLGRVPALGASIAHLLASRLARTSAWMSEQSKGGIVGQLDSMPPAELVQALNINAQSGTLTVTNENKTIEVEFLDGQVLDAHIEDLHGEQAFFMLLAWTKGEFKFKPGRPALRKTVTLDTMGLIFRGLRQLDKMRAKKANASERHESP